MTTPLRTDLSGVTILESWRWDRYKVESDVEEAREKYNEARRKLALLDRERKLQADQPSRPTTLRTSIPE